MSDSSRTLIDRGVLVGAGLPLLSVVLVFLMGISSLRELSPGLFDRASAGIVASCPFIIIFAPILGLAIAARKGYRLLWSTLIPSVAMIVAIVVLISTETDSAMWNALNLPTAVTVLSLLVWIPVLLHWFLVARPRRGRVD